MSGIAGIIVEEGITAIGSKAFYSTKSTKDLKTVVLPESLIDLDTYIFYDCAGLETVNLPSKLTTIKDYDSFHLSNSILISCLLPIIFAPPLSIQKEALLDMPAICKTEEIFSFGGNLTVPINLVRQEVYQLIVANKLGRGLRFDPVIVT